MIKTFRSRGAELLFARKSVALFQAIELAQGVELIVRRKLAQLNAAEELRDLMVPPENCLEPAILERTSHHSVRISHAWQLCFEWRSHDAYDVDLVRSNVSGNLVVAEKNLDLLPPIHPGDILLQDFTRPHLISMNELALAMRLPATQIGAIIHGKVGITADVAFGLGSFFGTTAELWLNLQRDYDLQVAESAKLAAIG
ncbi:MAG: HigA family addiction module antitoxin [Candidatus Binataceae bacterium]